MRRRSPVLALLIVFALVSCQPVDRVASRSDEQAPSPTGRPLGAPAYGVPARLDELLARAGEVAVGWQDDPRPAEVLVELAPQGSWRLAQVTYLAADADRFLAVTIDREGLRQERPTLATLGLQPVTAAGMRRLPPWPTDVLEPTALAESVRAALRRCGGGGATGVLYATGAPVAWNGRRWTAPPQWTATVTSARAAVQADPVSGAAGPCVASES